jgi:hypothetical protein
MTLAFSCVRKSASRIITQNDQGRALAAANIEQKAIVDSDAMKQEEAKRKQRRIKMHAKVASDLKSLAIKVNKISKR